MDKPAPDFFARYRSDQGKSTLVGQVIVVAMMMALAAGFALAGARLSTDWRGGYLVVVAIIVALEASTHATTCARRIFARRLSSMLPSGLPSR